MRLVAAITVCSSAMFVLSGMAFALEPIDTDGPDFVESSEVVPSGHFQYEVDLTSVKNRGSPAASPSTLTPGLLKYGMAANVEVRIAPEGYLRQDGRAGAGDTAFGLKWHSQDRDASRAVPAVSWILHFDMPSGSPQFRGIGVRPSLRSVATWDLPAGYALGLMPGLRWDARSDGHRFESAIFGAVLNKRVTEQFRAFVEVSAPQITRQADGGVLADWDVGVAYLVNNDTQFGVRTGVAANRNTPSKYFLLEIAQRF